MDDMRLLVACESSERIKKAFMDEGYDAHSCDLKQGEQGLPNHHQCDVRELLESRWAQTLDMMIANPECTYLANSGVRWFFERPERWDELKKAIEFFNYLLMADIPRIVVENSIQHKYARQYIRKPDQIIQPWWFGEGETKATCLWLVRVPPLMASLIHTGREGRVFKEPPSPERQTNRSRTYNGIAQAMAKQWGNLPKLEEQNDKARQNAVHL